MLLCNVNIVEGENETNILLENGKIKEVSAKKEIVVNTTGVKIQFENAIAFPGLINSHDHLDFNLFPRLGTRVYSDYTEWGADIHRQSKETINAIEKIPKSLRIRWGIYKNLLNGITTVVNHGEYIDIEEPPITVFQDCFCLHSLGFEKNWRLKLNNPYKNKLPIVIHVGEGTGAKAYREINQVIHWNLFRRKLIAVHGIAMNEQQAGSFEALIWCPASNYFLFNKTPGIDTLKLKTDILFGTDSTLTSSWNAWKHIRLARDQQMVSDIELFDMLTKAPARIWQLNAGEIKGGKDADIIIVKNKNNLSPIDVFYSLNPEDILLMIHKGMIRLFDPSLHDQLNGKLFGLKNFYRVGINGECKLVQGNLPALMNQIKKLNPEIIFPVMSI